VPGEHENDRRASSRQTGLAQAQGEGAQILAIERQDVESTRLDFVIVLARLQDIEIGNTVNAEDDSFAINELICSTPRATRRVFQTSQT
jgi:predicted membrane GTPase involved in stress response